MKISKKKWPDVDNEISRSHAKTQFAVEGAGGRPLKCLDGSIMRWLWGALNVFRECMLIEDADLAIGSAGGPMWTSFSRLASCSESSMMIVKENM